jgi:hypothetical protein
LKLRKIRAVEIADIEGSDAVEGELVGGSAADAELLRSAGRQRTFETKGGGVCTTELQPTRAMESVNY